MTKLQAGQRAFVRPDFYATHHELGVVLDVWEDEHDYCLYKVKLDNGLTTVEDDESCAASPEGATRYLSGDVTWPKQKRGDRRC